MRDFFKIADFIATRNFKFDVDFVWKSGKLSNKRKFSFMKSGIYKKCGILSLHGILVWSGIYLQKWEIY